MGLRKYYELAKRPFMFPASVANFYPLSSLLDPDYGERAGDVVVPIGATMQRNYLSAVERVLTRGYNVGDDPSGVEIISSLGGGFGPGPSDNTSWGICPCLTKTRASGGAYYSMRRQRFLRTHELARLQGVPSSRFALPVGAPR